MSVVHKKRGGEIDQTKLLGSHYQIYLCCVRHLVTKGKGKETKPLNPLFQENKPKISHYEFQCHFNKPLFPFIPFSR